MLCFRMLGKNAIESRIAAAEERTGIMPNAASLMKTLDARVRCRGSDMKDVDEVRYVATTFLGTIFCFSRKCGTSRDLEQFGAILGF